MSHANWKLSYAGRALPPPDGGGFVPALQPIDSAERNANGDMILQPIAMKHTITVTWPKLTGAQTQEILSTLENNRSGKLVYYNAAKGALDEMNVYYGAGVSVPFARYSDDLSAQLWNSLTVNFIEM